MNDKKLTIPAEILSEIESIVNEIAKRQRRDFTTENKILSVYSENFKMQPRECAEKCNQIFGWTKNGDNIITFFKSWKLSNVSERERLFALSLQLSEEIIASLAGHMPAINKIDQTEKLLEQHLQLKRIVLVNLFIISPQLSNSTCKQNMIKMNKDFAAESLDAILMFIRTRYLFKASTKKNMSIEDYEKELFRLESSQNRANNMLVRLQDEFEDRLAENKIEAQANLISMLNSPKYGYILDLLISSQQGFRKLRMQKVDIPFEIGTTPTLVRKLLEFVSDCGITQILEIGEQIEESINKIEGYVYEGSPFKDENEVKKMTVISPGWQIKEKGIIISSPVVKEVE